MSEEKLKALLEGENNKEEKIIIPKEIEKQTYYVKTYQSFLLDQNLKPILKILFQILDFHCGVNGTCWQSFTTLSNECNVSKKTIYSSLIKLYNLGLIFYIPNFKESGRNSSNTYWVLKKDKETGNFIIGSLEIYKKLNYFSRDNKNGIKKVIPGR
jgi:hypothetical protein